MTKTIEELLQDLDDDTDALGQLMATNLNTMGVTGASASDGLTTLAGKILQVPSGGATVSNLTLTTNKPIVSYYDSDTATLTATATDSNNQPVSGATLLFVNGTTIIGSSTTNNNGIATLTYTSTGTGDFTIYATTIDVTSNTITIEDCYYFNDGSTTNGLEIGSNVSCTSNGEYITITASTSGEQDVKLPIALTGDWEYDVELAEDLPSSGGQLTFKIGTGQQWGAFNQNNTITVKLGSSQNFNRTVSKGMTLKITYISGVMTVYWNNEQLTYNSLSLGSGVKMGYYTNSGRYQYIKNIKLKPITV